MSRMKYLSQVFQPVINIPKNALIKNTEITCKSQKLLLECGLIRPTSSGLFTVLPLARRALNKLERLVRTCVEDVGGQQISLPALTSAALWQQSGRLAGAPAELLKLDDRHGKQYLLAPTHEESIADLLADVGPLSYKQLPLLLYQISNKYRDEHRPKHGVLRAREFSMMDLYGLHDCAAGAGHTYATVTTAYSRLFHKLQLPVYRVEAPAGDMGGSLSHEWQLCAAAGEDSLSVCRACSRANLSGGDACGCGGRLETRSSIEVGHTFILGTKYSEALSAKFVSRDGGLEPLTMSCYGIGITRLLAASLEALSTEKALRWPEAIAPYSTVVIGPKEGSKEWSSHGWDRVLGVGRELARRGDVLMDDRHGLTIGKRLMMADRMGYPTVVVCGKSTLESPPKYEVYRAGEKTPRLCTFEEINAHSGDDKLHSEDVMLHSEDVKLHSEDVKLHSEDAKSHSKYAKLHSEDAKLHSEDAKLHSEYAKLHSEDAKSHSHKGKL